MGLVADYGSDDEMGEEGDGEGKGGGQRGDVGGPVVMAGRRLTA